MKRFLVSLTLALALLGVFVGSAGATPKITGPKVADCSAFQTVADSGWFTFESGHLWQKTRIEQEYTPGGSTCSVYRVVMAIGTDYAESHYLVRDFCNSWSGLCGYYQAAQQFSFPGGVTYNFPGGWVDLSYSPGCHWYGRSYFDSSSPIYSPYICV